jgi:hypothetical protein
VQVGDLVRLTPEGSARYYDYYFSWEMLVINIDNTYKENVFVSPAARVLYEGKVAIFPIKYLEVINEVGS